VAAVLSPVLVFLMAIAVEILIDVLLETGVAAVVAFVIVGAFGWLILRKLRVSHLNNAPVEI
jgi:hypothetical protein